MTVYNLVLVLKPQITEGNLEKYLRIYKLIKVVQNSS